MSYNRRWGFPEPRQAVHLLPGATGCGLSATRALALGLVDLVHGAVSKFAHQLVEWGVDISQSKLRDLGPTSQRPSGLPGPPMHLQQLWLPGVQRQRSHLGAVDTKAPEQKARARDKSELSLPQPGSHLRLRPALWSQEHLWMPEHSMQSSTPRLMLAQRGSGWPQSPHWLLPATLCTRCRTLSPFTPRSRESEVESMLLVDGDAVRSSLCEMVQGITKSCRSSSLTPH